MKITRRGALKTSSMALGALALGGADRAFAQCVSQAACYPTDINKAQMYSYITRIGSLAPYTPLLANEMRISFMGSTVPFPRRAQAEMSIFVEVGPWVPGQGPNVTSTYDPYGKATDSFIFDCGSGVVTNYGAMGIASRKMDKIFINHLHADHMNDLSHIYCFGPSADRKSPLYVWGPSASGVRSPRPLSGLGGPPARRYVEGTNAYCRNLREAMRWHTESFGFETTAYAGYPLPTKESWGLPCHPIPVGDDAPNDAYAMVPIELDWTKVGGVAYNNAVTGVKITHFPVIHCRKGSLGYKLEWKSPQLNFPSLSMVYTSDTKPEWNSVDQACNGGNGIDVFIHEMAVPPEVWAAKMMGLPANQPIPTGNPAFDAVVANLKDVQDSSHTPQGAFGYLLKQIDPRPRLTVATHFPVEDDTVECALNSVRAHIPDIGNLGENLVWSIDGMVIRVFAGDPKPAILQQMVSPISNFSFNPPTSTPDGLLTPKYHHENGEGNPYAQLERSTEMKRVNNDDTENWCDSGY